jgi:pyridoxamine 5'-phosphate oxidase
MFKKIFIVLTIATLVGCAARSNTQPKESDDPKQLSDKYNPVAILETNMGSMVLEHRKYTDEGIDAKDLHENPFMQFKLWFDEIIDLFPIGANAMTLATSTLQGRCSARTVLLKYFDNKGFVFFTNYQSRKGQELSDNPYAALNFHCSFLQRDVRIEGIVAKVSREASIDYFFTR